MELHPRRPDWFRKTLMPAWIVDNLENLLALLAFYLKTVRVPA